MAQSTASGTSSRRFMREPEVSVPSSSRYVASEWETKLALLQRELEEARARAAQMEKTMKWWSDCTANWREKWSKVRNERNMAREEAKVLRVKLEIAIKDVNIYKHDAQELEMQNEQLKKEMEKIHMILLKHAVSLDGHNILPDRDIEEYVLQGAVPKHAVELYKENPVNSLERDIDKVVTEAGTLDDKLEKRQSSPESYTEDALSQKLSILQLKLDEATNTLTAEREEKNSLHRGMEKLKAEIVQLREECEELRESRVDAMRELLELKERFQVELSDAQADLIDETFSRQSMKRRLSELRAELEKLQAENAVEWGKRERLVTKKISLERQNKQLRNELHDLQERIDSRRTRPVSTSETDTRQLQQDLLVRNMAILKKSLEEKTSELSHAMRISEQYEAEVKRVMNRVEELKKELAAAQDEVDAATNSVRKLQRVNDDLLEQLESANVQLEHFRNSANPCGDIESSETADEKLHTNTDGELTDEYDPQQA